MFLPIITAHPRPTPQASKHVHKPTIAIYSPDSLCGVHLGNALHRMSNVLSIVHDRAQRSPTTIPIVGLDLDVTFSHHVLSPSLPRLTDHHLENHGILWYNPTMVFVF